MSSFFIGEYLREELELPAGAELDASGACLPLQIDGQAGWGAVWGRCYNRSPFSIPSEP
jgi:hypothetical protein